MNTFKRGLLLAATFFFLIGLSCRRMPMDRVNYHLVHPTGCQGNLVSAQLELYEDGTFKETAHFLGDSNPKVDKGAWQYDSRRGKITLSHSLVSESATFDIVVSHPSVILVNKANDCWYGHSK